MDTWSHYIDRFKQKCDKAFTENLFFCVDLIYCIHKWVKVFLRLCKIVSLNNVEIGSLLGFRELPWRMEKGEWITFTPIWIEFPEAKEDGKRKLDSKGCPCQAQRKMDMDKNRET